MNGRGNPLLHLVVVVRDLCQLRRGPQDLPYSPVLLALLIAASILIDLASGTVISGASNVLPRSLVSTSLVLGLCWIALSIRRLGSRFVQTASAVIACSIVISLLAVPIVWLAGAPPASGQPPAPLQVLLAWAMLALIVWNVAINANIVRHALEAPFAFGVALATAWLLADWALGRVLFDAAG